MTVVTGGSGVGVTVGRRTEVVGFGMEVVDIIGTEVDTSVGVDVAVGITVVGMGTAIKIARMKTSF